MQLSITLVIIVATVAVSWRAFNDRALLERLVLWPPAVERRGQYDRLLTYGLVHADWMHLLFNMITLLSFGRAIEGMFTQWIGALGYLGFYLSALLVSILPTWLRHRHDAHYRSLGASGAVSAVLFAYVLFSPMSKLVIFPIPIPIPAILFAVLYVAYSIWMDRRGGGNVNHSAHLWGAGYGVLFTVLLEPRVLRHFVAQLGLGG